MSLHNKNMEVEMSSNLLQYTQKVRGFQHQKYIFSSEKVISVLKRTCFRCPCCGSKDVFAEYLRPRIVQGLPVGISRYYIQFDVHRIYCRKCHCQNIEKFHFLSHPKSRITKALERTLIELRRHMSLRAVSEYFGLRCHTV